jgi:hypothetical protein
VAGALSMCSGCHVYRATSAPLPDGAQVRVRLSSPSAVALALPGRDSVQLEGVTQIDGRVLVVRGDTIRLRATRIRRIGTHKRSARDVPKGGTLNVVAEGGNALEVRRLSTGRTVAAVVAGTFGFLVAAAILVLSGTS